MVTEVTTRSWGGRIMESIKGILVGLALFAGSFPLLIWNEGRAVKRYRDLAEGRAAVVVADAATVDPALEGKLVHMGGEATTDEVLAFEAFGVSAPALRLRRTALMYQWREESETRKEKKLGGKEVTETTYRYEKVWAPELIASGGFKEAAGHENPASLPITSAEQLARQVSVGAHQLSEALLRQIDRFEPLAVSAQTAAGLDATWAGKLKVHADGYYLGADPAAPQIGDVKVTFEVVRPTTVSFIARQAGATFGAWPTPGGRMLEQRLELGAVSAEAIFGMQEQENALLTWGLRALGAFLMFFGITLVFKPLVVVADVVPFVGSLLGGGVAIFAFLVTLICASVTIAIAWIAYRPLIAVPLLLLAAGGAFALWKRRQAPATAPSPAA